MLDSLENKTEISERQLRLRAERAERRLAELLSTMPEGYITLNRNWIFTFANEQAVQGSLHQREDLVGKNVWTLWPSLAGTEVDRHYRRVMETRIEAHFEHYSQIYDAWFEMHVYPVEDGIGVFYEEITQRRRAEEALQESERRYRAFTELNPQLILMADTNGQVTHANQRLLDYSGMTLDETRGEGWRKAVHPDDDLRVLHAWMEALARDVDFEIETRIRRGSDGAFRWFWVRGLPVRDDQNKTLYWLGVCIDVHEHRMAVEDLKKSQQETEHQRLELETVYRTAPIGLALFDPVEFRYLRLNDRQAEMVGLPTEDIQGKTLTEIAPIEGLNEMFQQVAQGNPITNQLLEGELPMQPSRQGEQTVHALTRYAGVSQPAVSKHLTVLKRAKLVRHRREGRETHYRARPDSLAPMVDWMRHYGAFWSDRFDRLEALLERMES